MSGLEIRGVHLIAKLSRQYSCRWTLIAAATVVGALAAPALAGSRQQGSIQAGSQGVIGKCTYHGSTTLSGELTFRFGGVAVASSEETTPPPLSSASCTLISPAQGLAGEQPELRASTACPQGLPCTTPIGLAGPWPVRPVKICIEGPDIPFSCSDTPL